MELAQRDQISALTKPIADRFGDPAKANLERLTHQVSSFSQGSFLDPFLDFLICKSNRNSEPELFKKCRNTLADCSGRA